MFTPVAFWQLSQQPTTLGLTALNYGRFVTTRANGINNRAQWSNDGVTWNAATTNGYLWNSVDFSPELGLYVATDRANRFDNLMSSTNGVTWTLLSKSNNQRLGPVTWCSTFNKFLIYGDNNMFESSDGLNWSVGFYHGLSASGYPYSTPAAPKRGLFTTFSSANHTAGTSSTGKSIYAIPTGYFTASQTMVIYSEDGSNFKTYSVFNATQVLSSISFTRVSSYVDYYISMQNTNSRILSTQSMNATVSTTWNQIAATTGAQSSNQNSSLQPENFRGCVTYCLNSTSATTGPIRYSLSYVGSGPSIQVPTFPSAVYGFYDILYCKALSIWVVGSNANVTVGAIWTGGSGAGGTVSSTFAPTTWTQRTAFGTITSIVFGEGVRTTGYRKGASIT